MLFCWWRCGLIRRTVLFHTLCAFHSSCGFGFGVFIYGSGLPNIYWGVLLMIRWSIGIIYPYYCYLDASSDVLENYIAYVYMPHSAPIFSNSCLRWGSGHGITGALLEVWCHYYCCWNFFTHAGMIPTSRSLVMYITCWRVRYNRLGGVNSTSSMIA